MAKKTIKVKNVLTGKVRDVVVPGKPAKKAVTPATTTNTPNGGGSGGKDKR